MLTIMRRYTIGVSPYSAEVIESKLKEFGISVQHIDHHGMKFGDTELVKRYYVCMSNEEDMDKLIEYLQLKFKGIASIIF